MSSSSSGMLTEEEAEAAFRKFRPFCSALAANPRREILEKLDRLIGMSHPDDLERLQEYIIFPMQLYLKTPVMPENYTILVLNVIERMFKHVKLQSFFILKDIFTNLLPIMSGLKQKSAEEKPVAVSEDLKEASCDCLARLIRSAEQDVLEKFYDEEMKLPISHLVLLALEFTEKNQTLTHLALSCLNLISGLCPAKKDEGESTSLLSNKFRALFKQMLPGITTNLMKVMKNASANLSWKVKVAALECWTSYVIEILNDDALQSGQDEAWTNKACDHIQMQMQILQGLAAASSSTGDTTNTTVKTFRKQLLKMVKEMLRKCKKSLENLR